MKMLKIRVSHLFLPIIICLLVSICSNFSIIHAQTATIPSTGNGSEANPYQISTLDNLYWLSQSDTAWNKHYIQVADIDAAATSGWDSGSGFDPIGNGSTQFTGVYDGDEHLIENLFISRNSTFRVGLFGFTDGAEIKNIGLVDVNISGKRYVGALVGDNSGQNSGSSINNSFSTGSVSGTDNYIGGLVGLNFDESTISNSYSTATVSGVDFVGGLAGSNYGTSTNITNSYSTGNISGGSSVGGLVGENVQFATTTSSYWDTESSGQSTSASGTGLITSNMLKESSFTGWDFTTVWDNVEDIAYPFLRWQNDPRAFNIPSPSSLPPRALTTVNDGGNSATLTWYPPLYVEPLGYRVYREGMLVNEDNLITDTTYTDTDLINYTTYTWTVTAVYIEDADSVESGSTNTADEFIFPSFSDQSLEFDGIDDYVLIPDDNTLDLTNAFTIEAWIKSGSIGSEIQRIVSKPGAYGFGFNNSFLRFTTYGTKDYDFSYDLTQNKWTHLACVLDASNDSYFYVNGNLVGSVSGSSSASTSSAALNLGGTPSTESLNGLLDELRIWNDERTLEEIRQNMFQSLKGDEQGLVSYWTFDDGSHIFVKDSSASGNNGALYGAAHNAVIHPNGTFITGNEGWRMMTAPVSRVSYGELLDTLWTQGFTGSDSPSNGTSNVYT